MPDSGATGTNRVQYRRLQPFCITFRSVWSLDRVVNSSNMNTEPNKFVRLLESLEGFDSFEVLLVGDFMLDQQIRGAAERLSPEAPIPILRATSHRDVTSAPGGSGNVASCLAALGAKVHCFGVILKAWFWRRCSRRKVVT
jgi:hypothetical protein